MDQTLPLRYKSVRFFNKLIWCYILLYFGSSHCRDGNFTRVLTDADVDVNIETMVQFSPHDSIGCEISKNVDSFVPQL